MRINPEHDNMIDIDDGWTDYVEVLRTANDHEPVLRIHAGNPGAYLSMDSFRELYWFLERHQCPQCGGLLGHGCSCPPPQPPIPDPFLLVDETTSPEPVPTFEEWLRAGWPMREVTR